jgi:hypothetical protein
MNCHSTDLYIIKVFHKQTYELLTLHLFYAANNIAKTVCRPITDLLRFIEAWLVIIVFR